MRDLDERAARRGPRSGSAGSSPGGAVDRVLDDVAEVDLLDARRRELQQLGERDLRVLAADAERQAGSALQQARAACRRAPRRCASCSGRDRVGELLEQLALLAGQPRGIDDVDDDAQVAAAAAAPQRRHALRRAP